MIEFASGVDFICTRIVNNTRFIVRPNNDFRGCEFLISDWRLRNMYGPQSITSCCRALSVVREQFIKVLSKDKHEMFKFTDYLHYPGDEHNELEAMLECPRTRMFTIPWVALMERDKTRYEIERAPWPNDALPRYLFHFARQGFESGLAYGIVAVPTTGDDYWIVSEFSKCKVNLQWDRERALLEEFPQLTAIARDLQELKGKGKLPDNIRHGDFTASAHFTNLAWRGKTYVLANKAARIIEALYVAQASWGLLGLHRDEIFGQIYTANKNKWPSADTRIQNFFRRSDAKRLWDDGLISHDGQGNFHLNIKIHT